MIELMFLMLHFIIPISAYNTSIAKFNQKSKVGVAAFAQRMYQEL